MARRAPGQLIGAKNGRPCTWSQWRWGERRRPPERAVLGEGASPEAQTGPQVESTDGFMPGDWIATHAVFPQQAILHLVATARSRTSDPPEADVQPRLSPCSGRKVPVTPPFPSCASCDERNTTAQRS